MKLNKMMIHAEWCAASRQTQHKVPVIKDLLRVILDTDRKFNKSIFPYLFSLGLNSFIRFETYFAAHKPTESAESNIISLIFKM